MDVSSPAYLSDGGGGTPIRQLDVFRRVARVARLRGLACAYLLFAFAEYSTWVAISIYAYDRGGAVEAGIAGGFQLSIAAAAAPFAGYLGDRIRRDAALVAAMVAMGCASIAVAAAISAESSPWVVYVFGAVVAATTTGVRPATAGLLPAVTDTPESMVAATVAVEVSDSLGIFIGPALAAVVMAWGGPATVFVVASVLSLTAGLVIVAIRFEPVRVRPTGRSLGRLRTDLSVGARVAFRDPSSRSMILIAVTGFFVAGALDVQFISVANELIGGSDSTVGFLAAAAGFGGLLGAGLSIGLIGRSSMSRWVAIAALIGGLPLVLVAVGSTVAVAAAGFAASGLGLSALHIAARTFLQRSSADDVLVRTFGVMESASQLSLAVGAISAGLLVTFFGARGSLFVLALVLPGAIAVLWPELRRADRRAPTVDPTILDGLRSNEMLGVLGPAALEQLSLGARSMKAVAGDQIIVHGDVGDRFYVVVEGEVCVLRDGAELARLTAGQSFGEIALIEDRPRTADVIAVLDTALVAIGREQFLDAVTGNPQVSAVVAQAVAKRS